MAQRPSRLTVGMLSSLKDKIRYIDRMLFEKSSPGRNVTGHNFTKRKHSLRQKCRPRQYTTRAGIPKACSRKKTDLKVDSFQLLFTDAFLGV
jgi:hypothetical protein